MIKELDIATGYNKWASLYESDGNPMTGFDEKVFRDEFPFNVKGKTIADIGCGTGRHTIKLSLMGADVTGVDISEGMIEEGKKKSGSEKVNFICHDLSKKLPLEDDTFDFVISSLVLEHIKDLHLFFNEIKRICKPEGLIYITAMHPAMMLLNVQANFKEPDTGEEIRPQSYPNQICDFINNIISAGLKIEVFKEYFCSEELIKEYPRAKRFLNWPMLIMFKLWK